MSRSRRSAKSTTAPRRSPTNHRDDVVLNDDPRSETHPEPSVTSAGLAAPRQRLDLSTLSDGARVTLIILAGTILRLAIAPWGRYWEDSQVLAFRSERLATLPMNQLYLTDRGTISHLPGDLWFLFYISNLFRALSPNGDFYGDTFLYLTKTVPILADAGAALAIFLIARHLASPTAGLIGAALYTFNPAPIVISSIWDQWDAISTCAALFALYLFLRQRYEFAAMVLTYAALVKPQFALFGALFALVYVRRLIWPTLVEVMNGRAPNDRLQTLARPVARAVAAVIAAYLTAQAILLPFNVSLPPLSARFDLRDRLEYVFRVHDETTLNAFNLWATPLAGNALEDYQVTFLSVTARTWGQILFGAALLVIARMWWKNGSDRAIVWAGLSMTFASFMLPTRIHERYILPTLALSVLIAAIQPRLLWYAIGLTITCSANLIAVYVMAHDQRGAPFFAEHDPWMTLGALANCVLFVWIVVRGLPTLEATDDPGSFRRSSRNRRGFDPLKALRQNFAPPLTRR